MKPIFKGEKTTDRILVIFGCLMIFVTVLVFYCNRHEFLNDYVETTVFVNVHPNAFVCDSDICYSPNATFSFTKTNITITQVSNCNVTDQVCIWDDLSRWFGMNGIPVWFSDNYRTVHYGVAHYNMEDSVGFLLYNL